MVKFQWFPDRDDSPRFFFSNNEKKKISEAIAILEKKTSAELRVHVEKRNSKIDLMVQARAAFEAIGMTKTGARNGVLIFICADTHEFAVLGDEGIDSRVQQGFWTDTTAVMEADFRKGLFLEGVSRAIQTLGQPLAAHFPYIAGDRNELSNDVSQG
jgi:uncharacterized membrane protein